MSSKTLEMARKLVKRLEEEEKKSKVQLCELHPGDTFKIGDHDFIVLDQNEYAETTAVISKGFMAEDIVFDDDTRNYSKSNLERSSREIFSLLSKRRLVKKTSLNVLLT